MLKSCVEPPEHERQLWSSFNVAFGPPPPPPRTDADMYDGSSAKTEEWCPAPSMLRLVLGLSAFRDVELKPFCDTLKTLALLALTCGARESSNFYPIRAIPFLSSSSYLCIQREMCWCSRMYAIITAMLSRAYLELRVPSASDVTRFDSISSS